VVAGQSPLFRGGPGRGRGRGGQNGTMNGSSLPFRPVNGDSSNHFNNQQPSTRGGYTPIDRGDDQSSVVHHNPNFRPKSHHNVPPPSSLEQSASRGRGRGRGFRGRGRGVAQANGTD